MKQKIYISGKITGLEKVVYEFLFERAEQLLTERGFVPVNPCKIHSECVCGTWEDFMLHDIKALFDCDGIYMLSNWRESRGARIENFIAQQLNKRMLYEHLTQDTAIVS